MAAIDIWDHINISYPYISTYQLTGISFSDIGTQDF